MSWLRRNLHWVLLVGFLLTGALGVGIGAVGAVYGLAAAASNPGVVLPLLRGAVPFAVPALLLLALSVAFLLGSLVTVVRRVSLPRPSSPRSERLAEFARRLEGRYPILRSLEASDRFEPTDEQRRERLKERYVEGEISRAEFERRMEKHVDDEGWRGEDWDPIDRDLDREGVEADGEGEEPQRPETEPEGASGDRERPGTDIEVE